MKRVIGGKLYDTETAECVHEWSNGYFRNDFHHCEEALYKTAKGAWFLSGEGGPLSKYAEHVGNESHGGDGIQVLTGEEALAWLERVEAPADIIAEHFPDVEEA